MAIVALGQPIYSQPVFNERSQTATLASGQTVIILNDAAGFVARVHDAGGELVRTIPLYADGTGLPVAFDMAALADGGFVITGASGSDAVFRVFNADGSERTVGNVAFAQPGFYDGGTQTASQVIGLPGGGFFVAWNTNADQAGGAIGEIGGEPIYQGGSAPPGTSVDIWGQRFNADGTPAGDAYRLTEGTIDFDYYTINSRYGAQYLGDLDVTAAGDVLMTYRGPRYTPVNQNGTWYGAEYSYSSFRVLDGDSNTIVVGETPFEQVAIGTTPNNFGLHQSVVLANGQVAGLYAIDGAPGSGFSAFLKLQLMTAGGAPIGSEVDLALGLTASNVFSFAALPTADNGFVVVFGAPEAGETGQADIDLYMRRYSANGTVIETSRLTSTANFEVVRSFELGPDGSYILTWYNPVTGVTQQRFVLTNAGETADTGSGSGQTFNGGSGTDWYDAEGGNDTLNGFGGSDKLYGGAGDDLLRGGTGADTLAGGSGIDTATYDTSAAGVTVNLATGLGSGGDAAGDKLSGIENLTGSDHADRLTGDAAANAIRSGGGDDIIDGGGGADKMYGGGGNDRYYVDSAGDLVDEGAAGSSGIDTIFTAVTVNLQDTAHFKGEIENLTALSGFTGVNLYGNALANTLTGNNVGNTLNGRGGADIMRGLGGFDIYYVDNIGDVVDESVSGSGGTDTVLASISVDLTDNVHFKGGIERVTLQNGIAGLNATGNALDNLLIGSNFGNMLDGGAGADIMRGMDGFDTYYVDNVGDVVDESVAGSGGTDTVIGRISIDLDDSAHFKGDIERASLFDSAGAVNLTGNAIGNLLKGNSFANTIDGRRGADTMQGLGGNDRYYVDNAGDIVDESVAGSGGTDTVFAAVSITLGDTAQFKGQIERATLLYGWEDVNVTGNGLANRLSGNELGNTLNGADGNDTLTGGAGTDKFVFDTALNASTNVDRITDFNVKDDTIRLDNAIFTLLTDTGGLAADLFKNTANGAIDADDRIIYDSATGALFYDTNGSAAGGATQFAILSTGLALTAKDFVII